MKIALGRSHPDQGMQRLDILRESREVSVHGNPSAALQEAESQGMAPPLGHPDRTSSFISSA